MLVLFYKLINGMTDLDFNAGSTPNTIVTLVENTVTSTPSILYIPVGDNGYIGNSS